MDQLRSLIKDIVENPEKLNTMSKEQVLELQKQINPYGAVKSVDKKFANMSITNWREEYLKKLLTTAFVGYLYRCAQEFDTESQYSGHLDFLRDPDLGLNISEEKFAEIRKKATLRPHIDAFLDYNFNFNPDRHVNSSYRENLKDPERPHKFDAFRQTMATAARADAAHVSMTEDPKATLEFLNDTLLRTYQLTTLARTLTANIARAVSENSGDVDSQIGLLLKYEARLQSMAESMKMYAMPIAAKETVTVYRADPPTDVFYHFNRYLTNHYENLREATQVLYADKPDIEFAVQFYDAWGGPEGKARAEDHQKKNETSVVSSIYTLENGGWTIMGPFQENRERVNFYNKNTEVIKRLFEQMESDHKLGKDLMEKRVRVQKGKNIAQEGPDDPGLRKYAAAVSTIETLGAKKVLSEEDKKTLHDATRLKEMAEVPANAIQVDTFRTTDDGKLVRDKFYTEAEAPDFMEKQVEELKSQLMAGGKPVAERIGKANGV